MTKNNKEQNNNKEAILKTIMHIFQHILHEKYAPTKTSTEIELFFINFYQKVY